MASAHTQPIKVAVFNAKDWVKESMDPQLKELELSSKISLEYFEQHLNKETCSDFFATPPQSKAKFEVVSCFVNDQLDESVLRSLSANGVKMIALRCAGFDNLDLKVAQELGLTIARVPAYSPYAVAEHAVTLMTCLNRKIPQAISRVRKGNFSLDGLQGFDMNQKVVGVIGTGKIGRILTKIVQGYGCKVLCYDIKPNLEFAKEYNVPYVELEQLLRESDIISLHAPLTQETRHMIDEDSIRKMKRGVILVNTSRGALVDTKALLKALEDGYVAAAGLDVYEREIEFFFEDRSNQKIADPTLQSLIEKDNVILTGHQAFFTREALANIAKETLENIVAWKAGTLKSDEPRVVFLGKETILPSSE